MKKEYIIGGLAIVGAIALFNYLSKPKTNSGGFSNASGRIAMGKAEKGSCAVCKTSNETYYHTGTDRNCKRGDNCVTRYSFSASSY